MRLCLPERLKYLRGNRIAIVGKVPSLNERNILLLSIVPLRSAIKECTTDVILCHPVSRSDFWNF